MIRNLFAAIALLSLGASPAFAREYHSHRYHRTYVEHTGYYTNVSGHSVHRPAHADSRPSGASAQCVDGTYSFSEHRRGTCSHHGGVSSW